jgi:Flp pilus assembly protein TadG
VARLRRGSTVLQTAVVMPVLLMVAMGVIEFGQFLYIRSAFQAAARDAARATSLPGATQTAVQNVAIATLAQANVVPPDITQWMTIVDIPVSGGSGTATTDVTTIPSGDRAQVTITTSYYQVPNAFHPLHDIFGKGISSGKQVSGVCTVVKE